MKWGEEMTLGIDLGTTYSVGAYLDEQGAVQIIDNSEGRSITPSVVFFDDGNNIVVGEIAKDNAVIRPDDVVAVVKNHMGKKIVLKEWQGTSYTPEMISSFILRKVYQDSKTAIGKDIEGVVITVPAYFTDAQRKATEDAAVMAGIPLIGMINEPTAAALCYVKTQKIRDENLLVYDLGGGTFDVTILHVKDIEHIEVLSTGGLSNAGGRFFDQYVVDYVRNIVEEKYDIDLEDDEYTDELQDLYLKAENVKIQLSSRTTAKIVMKVGKIKETIDITREQFEKMIQRIYVRTESKVSDALKEAGLVPAQIDRVLMVGGSSRIPYVSKKLQEFIGREPSKDLNPDEVVASGAAIYADLLARSGSGNTFTDVCSHSIGVVVTNRQNQMENEIIIHRNTTLPVEKEQRFRTIVQNQNRIALTITEGEYKELTDVTLIGEYDIRLPPNLPEHSLVLIRISLDRHQLIHIRIALPDANFEQEYHMKREANMSEEEVANITGILQDYTVS